MTIEPGATHTMEWTFSAGSVGEFSQQIHFYIGLGDSLVEHMIPVSGVIAASTDSRTSAEQSQ